MSKDYLSEFLPDLEEFRKKTIQFHNKELSVAEFLAALEVMHSEAAKNIC